MASKPCSNYIHLNEWRPFSNLVCFCCWQSVLWIFELYLGRNENTQQQWSVFCFFFEKLLMEKNTYIIFVLFQSSMQFVCPSLCSIPHCRIFSKSACFQKLPYKFSQYATGGMNSKHAEGVGSLEGRHPDWQTPASSYVIVASGIETTTPGGLEQDRTRRWWYSWRFMTRKSKACIRWCIDADVMV